MNLVRGLLSLLCLQLFHVVQALKPPAYRADIDHGKYGSYPVKKFISSKLRAPEVNFLQWHPECDDGLYYFISPRGWKVKDPGPMILDGQGNLIFSKHFDNKFGGQAYDFKVQRYLGEDYLTFWLGDDTVRGHGAGHYYMLNSSYDIVYEIGAQNGLHADLHDFVITPEGTGLLVIFQPARADVRPLGRKFSDLKQQAIWDCLFQEVNIQTGELIFEWRASQHIDLTHTYHKLDSNMGDSGTRANPFDFFHINSVNKDELGNYLVSARNLQAVLYIDGRTKDAIWTLGGKNNDFEDLSDGHALNFAWQHDAQFVSPEAFPETYTPSPEKTGVTTRLMTLFDNAAMDWKYEYGPSYSRALLLEITYPTPGAPKDQSHASIKESPEISRSGGMYRTNWRELLSKQDLEKIAAINGTSPSYRVRVVREFINPKHVISSTQGSAQLLSQGNGKDPRVLVGYGINAVITEFSSNGSVLCDMHFGAGTSWEKGDVQSYRAYKLPWVGRPKQRPAVAIRNRHIYASWNGATECREWILQSSRDKELKEAGSGWADIAHAPKQGFETAIPLDRLEHGTPSNEYMRVLAICEDDNVCENGISEIIQDGGFLSWLPAKDLSNIHPSFDILTIAIVCLAVASMIFMVRMLRNLLRHRRHNRSSRGVLPSQRRID